jgi:hypothetical protein
VHFAKYFLATFPRIDPSSRDVPAALKHKIKKEWKKNSQQMSFLKKCGSFSFNSLNQFTVSSLCLPVCQQSVQNTLLIQNLLLEFFIFMLNYLKFYHTTKQTPF